MPSDLQVTNLKANDGTAGLVIADSTGNITLNNPITSGTFKGSLSEVPNIYQTTLIIPGSDWDSDYTGGTEKSIGAYVAWQNKKASSTVHVEITAFTAQSVGTSTSQLRYGRYNIYKSLSAVADAATSGFGTKIAAYIVGRKIYQTTGDALKGYQASHFYGSFTSESSAGTNHYIGMSTSADSAATRTQFISSAAGTTPALIRITEIA